jgi:hypothetical protein
MTEKSVVPSAGRHHDLAVHYGRTRFDPPGVMGDLLEAMRPIVAAAGEYLRRFVGEMDLNTVPVELDFVNPTFSRRHLLDRGGQGRFDEAGEGCLDADGSRFSTLKRH